MSFITDDTGQIFLLGDPNTFLVTDQNNLDSLSQYRLLAIHQINDQSISPGTIVREGFDVPPNWVPTMEVDPLNSNAADAFYAAGPRPQPQSRVFDNQNPRLVIGSSPVWIESVTFWFQRGNFWFLSGLGSNKPPVVQ